MRGLFQLHGFCEDFATSEPVPDAMIVEAMGMSWTADHVEYYSIKTHTK
jgi:hypothetical protein